MRLRQPRRESGRRDGARADVETLRGLAEIGVDGAEIELGLGSSPQRALDEEVEELRPPAGRSHHHEAAAEKSRENGLGDAGRQRARDGGVDRGAAGAQDVLGGAGGELVTGGNREAGHWSVPGRQSSDRWVTRPSS